MISLMWAMDENRVIGINNELPWHLPEDLKFFKRTTMGHPIAMGRKTWESIGRPLPGRENIVITRNKDFSPEGATVLNSLDELIDYSNKLDQDVFVIGGAEIFKSVLPFSDHLYMTMIHHQFAGDTYFPELDLSDWKNLSTEKGLKDDKNPYDYEFKIYQRK
ncbi:dihydrofolate reductase [Cytobacillus purgationiresistens]|uniref:Dihydrofolate reductase n=1 Tax=Cytobacillus purgationiresistens TaxID=863449 RepID=A0ABU0ALU7_9BACI|nr:dihydrofolate reductase [Cytobacillus purgationiresistens]MDQ0272010.1 dihydrofolate reductase [Cytobacillus purgationiresistens]